MKTNIKKFSYLFFSLAILLASCSENEPGPVGPKGDTGDTGEQGATGPAGDVGAQGEPGTANVIYSDWLEANYLLGGAQESNLMGLEVFSDAEMNPITDVVLVYGQRDADSDNDGIYPLPYTFASQQEYYGFGLFEVTGGTGLQVRVNSLDGGTNLFTFFTEYRYVIIPGGVPANGRSTDTAVIDYSQMSYDDIVKLFNIPD